ncbi:MAG TPA: LON peptidase substrate-binding domain-containing protein [Chthonomonadales bacterium]|nr:LON peptidase substrate-binding domain-containing protein [Chthonomonadales bacterium]
MGTREIPLFPLQAVLFPRMPMPLRIFEDRYRIMIERCIEHNAPFGVVLIREGEESAEPATPVSVGTLAQIHAVQKLEGGRVNILTVGSERFRVVERHADREPYLIGVTEPYADDPPADVERLSVLSGSVSGLFGEYFKALISAAGVDLPEYDLPSDAVDLSFVIAAVIQVPLEQRQTLLEMTDTAARLEREQAILQGQIEVIRRTPPRKAVRVAPFNYRALDEVVTNN